MICHRFTAILFLLLSIAASSLFGQSRQDSPPQIVELKDGSRLLGTILEDNDYAVTIAIITGDTLEIGYKYISAVGPIDDSRVVRRGENGGIVQRGDNNSVIERGDTTKPGLYVKDFVDSDMLKVISAGISFGDESGGGFIGSFHLIKKLNPKLGVGGGLSFNTYTRFILNDVSTTLLDMSFLPVYVSSRYVIGESITFKPFLQLDLGYGFGIATDRFDFNSDFSFNGGAYGQLHLGTTIANYRNYNMQLSLNLLYQGTSGNISGFDFNFNNQFQSSFDLNLIRPGFTLGIVF